MSTSEQTHDAADGRPTNRLAGEASPYLLQHARNPVDWWPWCDEALAEARRRDVPILLSIGYSACHWCHVMERESFEDPAIARLMNERFVNVKVDREERPDLDQIYQLVVQLMGRSGGWPLTVFLTPDQRPFFGGTYFPPEDRHGMPGFPRVLDALSEAYRAERGEIEGQAAELTEAIARASRADPVNAGMGEGRAALGPDLLAHTSALLLARFDEVNGGFGRRPKFPSTMPLDVLLRRGALEGDGRAKDGVRLALEQMRKGGVWDHLGGGFHRYSTDERWLVPHFEKMLYDNALLLRAYADGHRVFGAPLFRDTALAIAGWVAREMTDGSGGFYASQDADSEGEEGRFFVWDEAEIAAALEGDALATRAAVLGFGVTPEGNFEDHGRATGKTVLHEALPDAAVAARLDVSEAEARQALVRARERLFHAREARPRPLRDEKILASWNALLVSALADAGAALDAPELLGAAERALAILEARLVSRDERGRQRVARLAKGDLVKGPGFLDDQAYLANAALDVYEASGDPRHAALARGLVDGLLDLFHAPAEGFFFTAHGGETLIARPQDPFDNAVPSGASMACRALLRLGTLTDASYAVIATRELERLAPAAMVNPFGYGQLIGELDRLVRGSVDVVLVGPRDHATTRALARTVHVRYLPNRTLAWVDPRDPASLSVARALAEGKPAAGSPVAYVCRGRTCSLPVTTPAELDALLAGATGA